MSFKELDLGSGDSQCPQCGKRGLVPDSRYMRGRGRVFFIREPGKNNPHVCNFSSCAVCGLGGLLIESGVVREGFNGPIHLCSQALPRVEDDPYEPRVEDDPYEPRVEDDPYDIFLGNYSMPSTSSAVNRSALVKLDVFSQEGLDELVRVVNDVLDSRQSQFSQQSQTLAELLDVVKVTAAETARSELSAKLAGLSSAVSELASQYVRQAAQELIPQEHFITVQDSVFVRGTIDGRPHKDLQTLVNVAAQRLPVMLVGPAGSGKTTAAYQTATCLDLAYYESSMGPATSQWDLIGYRSPVGEYVPGILREPYENGGILMLDEMDNTNPSVLTALNAAISNTQTTFPDGPVSKHSDFVLIAAGNTYGRGADRMYVGRNQLDAATLDRFVVIDWPYDEEAEVDWAGRDRVDWTRYVQKVRALAMQHQMRVIISPRASIYGAKLLRAGMDIAQVSEMTLWKGMSEADRTRLALVQLDAVV